MHLRVTSVPTAAMMFPEDTWSADAERLYNNYNSHVQVTKKITLYHLYLGGETGDCSTKEETSPPKESFYKAVSMRVPLWSDTRPDRSGGSFKMFPNHMMFGLDMLTQTTSACRRRMS